MDQGGRSPRRADKDGDGQGQHKDVDQRNKVAVYAALKRDGLHDKLKDLGLDFVHPAEEKHGETDPTECYLTVRVLQDHFSWLKPLDERAKQKKIEEAAKEKEEKDRKEQREKEKKVA